MNIYSEGNVGGSRFVRGTVGGSSIGKKASVGGTPVKSRPETPFPKKPVAPKTRPRPKK